MQCKELETVLADDESPLSAEAREHLAACSACRDLLADFSAIAEAAERIPAEVNPPECIWVSLRAQLQAEGIIRESGFAQPVPATPWWNGLAQFFRPRRLAMVAAGLFVVAASVYLLNRPLQTNTRPSPVATTAPAKAPEAPKTVEPQPAPSASVVSPRHSQTPAKSLRNIAPSQPRPAAGELLPSPSELAGFAEGAAALNQTESALPTRELTNNPAVDALLRQNLRTLNEFIAECESRLKQNPRDQLTREYLNMAYQQKAELLSAMMDSGRSEH